MITILSSCGEFAVTCLSNSTLSDSSIISKQRNRYLQSTFLFTFFVVALVGNLTIIVKLCFARNKHPPHKLSTVSQLYLQLAIADIMAAFCCILSNAILYLTNNFIAGNAVCKVLKFLQKLGLSCTTFVVVAICLDRCVAVLAPLRRISMQNGVKVMIAAAWCTATIFSIPQVVIFRVEAVSAEVNDIYRCTNIGSYTEEWQEFSYDLINLIVLYVAPVIVITVTYVLIFVRITKNANKFVTRDGLINNEDQSSTATMDLKRTALFMKARRTSLIVSGVVILTFIICWAPLYISLLVHMINKPDPSEDYYYSHAIYFCGLAHSVLNPVIYGMFHVARQSQQAAAQCFGLRYGSRLILYHQRKSVTSSTKRTRTLSN